MIEFVGLPGSGKTTLSVSTVKKLKESDVCVVQPTHNVDHNKINVVRKVIKLSLSLVGIIKHPIIRIDSIWNLFKTKQKSFIQIIKLALNWLYVSELTRKEKHESKCSVSVMDQGIFQGLWSVSYDAQKVNFFTQHFLKNISFYLPKKVIVVVIDPDIQVVKNRLISRETQKARIEHDKYIDKSLKKAAFNLKQLKKLIKEVNDIYNISVFTIKNNNDKTISECSEEIEHFIKRNYPFNQ